MYLLESLFSVLLGRCLGMELLGLREILFNFLRKHYTVFPSCCTILHSHWQTYEDSNFSISLLTLVVVSVCCQQPDGLSGVRSVDFYGAALIRPKNSSYHPSHLLLHRSGFEMQGLRSLFL